MLGDDEASELHADGPFAALMVGDALAKSILATDCIACYDWDVGF